MPQQEKTLSESFKEAAKFISCNKHLLLSHHLPKDYGRCLTFGTFNVCARCFGFLLGILTSIFFYGSISSNWIFALTASFGLTEWILHRTKNIKSPAILISFLGLLMAFSYVYFLAALFSFNISIFNVVIALAYLTIFSVVSILTTEQNVKRC